MEFEFINFLLVELIPWLLRLVMVGLGLTLTVADLKQVMLFPKGVVTVLTIPLLTYAALQIFSQQGQMPSLPMIQMFQTLALFTVVPVCIGMLIRGLWPRFALRAIEVLRPVTMAVLILIVLVTAVTSYETISEHFFQSSLLVVGLNLLSMAMGYGLARAIGLNAAQRVTIAFEVGVQNLTLALLVTLTLLGDPALAITTLLYVAVMPFTAMAYVPIARRMLGPAKAKAST
jgi:BASS family bile acid:Na+ symporter